jgi:DNA-binding NarL/FixJ family response regulator
VNFQDDRARALVVAGDHIRGDYVRLLARLGLMAESFARADAAMISMGQSPPAVAILEVEDGGCEMLWQLRNRFGEDIPVILVSADRTSPADVVAGLLVGADDYAAESMDADEFIARVRRLVDRRRRPAPATLDLTRLSTLTAREREVLTLVAEGQSQKQIATTLGISVKTVGAHVQNLLSKLGLHSRVEAVALVVRAGAASPPVGTVPSLTSKALAG